MDITEKSYKTLTDEASKVPILRNIIDAMKSCEGNLEEQVKIKDEIIKQHEKFIIMQQERIEEYESMLKMLKRDLIDAFS
jgi:hypothetical protein